MQKIAGKPKLSLPKGLDLADVRRLINKARDRRMASKGPKGPCVYCGKPSEGEYAIHRNSEMWGVTLPLCNGCGAYALPTCEQIWDVIKAKGL